MSELERITGKVLEDAGVNPTLAGKFLDATFRDVFVIGMYPRLTFSRSELDAEVVIGSGSANIEDFVKNHSLHEKKGQMLSGAQDVRHHLLENCSELVFTTTFTDPSPNNKKNVIYFHEFYNHGSNMRKVWLDRATYYSGGIAALVTGALTYNQFVASQPWINIGQQSLGWVYIPAWTPPIFAQIIKRLKIPRRVWIRDRKYLGKEKIVEDEKILDKKYERVQPEKKGVYSGQFDRYRLYDPHKRTINLKQWQEHNKNVPLFKVVLADHPPSSIIWIVNLDAKIDGQKLSQEKGEVYRYPTQRSRSFIDNRYAQMVIVDWPT